MAALKVKWKTVDTITTKAKAVVTGDEESTEASGKTTGESLLRWTDKPILVYVCDDTVTCADSEKFEEIVLADEKVALGVRAFHTVRMTPAQVEADAILADHGKTTPRVLMVDPIKMKIKVLETKDLKASKLFKAMNSTAGKFWKQNLKKVVKEHLGLLTEQDQLVNAQKTLADKAERAADDKNKLKKVEVEQKEVSEKLADVTKQQLDLWKLTPKHKKA